MSADPLGLYLHIPFCQAICGYCNFNRGLLDAGLKTRYVAALEREILAAGDGRPADTVFFGGGTPSLLEPDEVGRLLTACRAAYRLAPDAEITLETNPETATADRLSAFREAGVNRISFGVQSFDDRELARLDRIHSAGRAKDAIRAARAAGFSNLSFDLMFWLPGQSVESWLRTIDEAIAQTPDHLSLYLLELYPNSPLKEAMARQHPQSQPARWLTSATPGSRRPTTRPPRCTSRLSTGSTRAGYEQYEISNVARSGYSSRHNVKYWQGASWRGFGCGAHSTVDGVRWNNVASTTRVHRRGWARPIRDRRPSPAFSAGPARGSALHGTPSDRRDRVREHPPAAWGRTVDPIRAGPRAATSTKDLMWRTPGPVRPHAPRDAGGERDSDDVRVTVLVARPNAGRTVE